MSERPGGVEVVVDGVSKSFENGRIRALTDVSLRLEAGDVVSLTGPTGGGKSTLLNLIGALDRPDSGSIAVGGDRLEELGNPSESRAATVGFVFQFHHLIPTLNALENVEVPMMGYQPVFKRRKRAKELLELVGLSKRMNHLPSQLSGGQRQRVAAARALANKPPLVLADEPTGNLDTAAGNDLMGLIRELNQSQGTTFVVVTHDLNVARQTRRVIVMADGQIARQDWIGLPIEEDLKVWSHSELGRRVLEKDINSLAALGISREQMESLHEIFDSNIAEAAAIKHE